MEYPRYKNLIFGNKKITEEEVKIWWVCLFLKITYENTLTQLFNNTELNSSFEATRTRPHKN